MTEVRTLAVCVSALGAFGCTEPEQHYFRIESARLIEVSEPEATLRCVYENGNWQTLDCRQIRPFGTEATDGERIGSVSQPQTVTEQSK